MRTGQRLKILYDHQIFSIQDFGGISKSFAMYAKEFSDSSLSIDAHIVAKLNSNHHLKEVALAGKSSFLPSFPSSKRIKLFGNRVLALLSTYKVDIFHPTFYFSHDLPKLDDELLMVSTAHDMTPELFPEMFSGGNPHHAKKKYLEHSRFIVCVSETTRSDLLRLYNVKEDKTAVVYHGINLVESEKSFQIKEKLPEKFLLYVGKRGGYKNFTLFFQAFHQLSKTHKDLNLICVGGGKFNSNESTLISKLGLNEKVRQFSATDSELRGLYKTAKAFVFPSLYEGFGIPILEAFAQHCPVVLSETSCFPEIAGEAASYFDPNSIESCIHAVESVISGDTDNMTKLAYKRAKEFTWRKSAESLSEIYHEVKATS